MDTDFSPPRRLFVASLLVEPDASHYEPASRYDEARDVTVLDDGTPLVECVRAAGTNTVTKSIGEREDTDETARFFVGAGTMTKTNATGESSDADDDARWGGTQLNTRRFPGDVEPD
jgi:hypothetical protein